MKNTIWQARGAVALFALTVFLFSVFFLYMVACEEVVVFQAEQTHSYAHLTTLELEIQTDPDSPTGIRKVYRGILDPALSQESCLCFNISHHDIQVYFDDTLVYSLTGAETNRIGKNVSNNWCAVHVGQTHAGKALTVVLTPLFEAAVSKSPDFLLGSHYSIAIDVLMGELPLMIQTALCILMGLFIVAVSVYFSVILRSDNGSLLYLGLFSISMGLWRFTDLRSTPLLFPDFAMANGYISIGSLFLSGLCLLMHFRTLFTKERQGVLLTLSSLGSGICLFVLAQQFFGMNEIRQNLVFSHILLVTAIVSIPLAALFNRIIHRDWGISRSWRLLGLLFVGIVLDLLFYYRNNGTGLMSFSILSFIIYLLIVFLRSVQESTRKAYTDNRTGLENRNRWNELMNSNTPIPEPYAIVFVDLNGLKHVNDTLGHEAGDQMIYELSRMLQNTMPRNSVICRWGGDEFVVLLTAVTREKLDAHIEALTAAGEARNADHPELPIHFAVGNALSSEHPGCSRPELFRLADEDMYRSKNLWYAQQ